jgi:hypothetical protein
LVAVHGSIYTRETDWDVHLSEFKEIVSLLDIYLASKPKRRYFVFDGETIAYLLLVVCKCRDGSIRRMALKLLEDRPRRESCWDTRYAAQVGRWVMTLEERGRGELRNHEIREEERVKVSHMDYDTAQGMILTSACHIIYGERIYHQNLWA